MKRVVAFCLLAAAACGASGGSKRPETRAFGIVWYRERIALPPDTVVQVEAVDGTKVLGRAEITPHGENPIPWDLGYDHTQAKGAVAFVARVVASGKVIFSSPEPVPPAKVVKIFVARPPEPRKQVSGQVTYPAGVLAPAGASCVVRLADQTTVLGEAVLPATDTPISFEIAYDPTLLDPSHTYEVTANVVHEGRAVLTATPVPVITQGHGTVVALALVPVQPPKPLLGPDAAGAVHSLVKGVPGVKTSIAQVDLNGDGDRDVVAFVESAGHCTAGACNVLVVEAVTGGYRLRSWTSGARRPISLSKNVTKGWKDLLVTIGTGRKAKTVALPFDGEKYAPDTAKLAPVDVKTTRAQVLIK